MARKVINPAEEPIPAGYKNVREAWALYDTIIVGKKGYGSIGWPESYAAMAGQQRRSFFNVRNSSEVGIAYNNLETKDQMPYVFHLYSIGCQFIAPPGIPGVSQSQTPAADYNAVSDLLFVQSIPEHIGFRLKIRQDEKLIHCCRLAPEGTGIYGTLLSTINGQAPTQSVTSGTNGQPYLDNRFKFPAPIAIPRGCTYSVEMEFSPYALELLSAMCGPGDYQFDCGEGPVTVEAVSAIRVSLIGKREVQQRGELHY